MKEELSRKERRLIRDSRDLKIIANITALTLKKAISWARSHCHRAHDEFVFASALINGTEVSLNHYSWGIFKILTISYGKEREGIYRTKRNKSNFDYLISVINDQILEKEKQEARKMADQDTTMILPLPPEEKAAEPNDREKLQKVIDFLTTP